jgi:hypothetical protein
VAEERNGMSGIGFFKRRAERVGGKPDARFAILEEWKVVTLADKTGALRLCLEGTAYGNSHPICGDYARTSALVRYRMEGRRLVVITRSGSEYMLGMRSQPQDEDKLRLIRYLDRIASARSTWPAASPIETDILGVGAAASERKAGF